MGDFPRHPTSSHHQGAVQGDYQLKFKTPSAGTAGTACPPSPQEKDVSRGKTMKDMKESYQFDGLGSASGYC